MTAKAAAVQRKEWESEVWQTVQDGLSINRYSDPSDPLYQRVGHGWQDWESLVGKCRCVFQKEMTSRMPLFKRSNKNKSASAVSTPAQTPRASVQTIRDSGIKMTPEEALYKISHNMMLNASNGPFVR
ncbi:hypothetical protein BGX33_011801 [Mortierella sp. NVP41]|nr:hypothetical protein BGX33_011801 [Mortierella sp. NVP41]